MTVNPVNFDNVLQDIGGFGRFQIGLYIIVNLMVIPSGMHHLGQVFIAPSMDYFCIQNVNHSVQDQCFIGNSSERCTDFSYDTSLYTSSLVSEFDLVCDRTWLQALSQSFYMLGVMFGVVGFGAMADKIGRHKVVMASALLIAVFGSIAAFMPDYWSFITVRLITGALVGGNMTTIFVMCMEVIGGPWRTVCGLVVQGWFGIGVMILSGIAYFVTDYRYLQLTISLIYVIFLPYYWLVPESVRWQLAMGNTEAAEKGIQQIAKYNNTQAKTIVEYSSQSDILVCEDNKKGTLLDLYRTPNLRKKTLNVQLNWFVNSLVYYGISLLSSELAGNVYINTCISGLTETLATLVFGPITEKMGRRWTLVMCMVVGGLICFCAIPIPEHLGILRTALALTGKFFISGSFAIIYVFSAELFPTVVRNVGVGNGSMCARVGGLVAPFVALTNKAWRPLPFIIFGTTAVISGLLSLLLPETLGKRLPETIEEGEAFGKNDKLFNIFVKTSEKDKSDGLNDDDL